MYSLSVLLLCKSGRRARSVVKTLQPVIGGDLKEAEQIVAFSSGTVTNPCRDETGPECMCWTDRLLLRISTVTWLYLPMGEISLFVLWEGHCVAEKHNDLYPKFQTEFTLFLLACTSSSNVNPLALELDI